MCTQLAQSVTVCVLSNCPVYDPDDWHQEPCYGILDYHVHHPPIVLADSVISRVPLFPLLKEFLFLIHDVHKPGVAYGMIGHQLAIKDEAEDTEW